MNYKIIYSVADSKETINVHDVFDTIQNPKNGAKAISKNELFI